MGKLSDQQKIEIVQKYVAGKNCSQLGEEYGVKNQSIEALLERRGIPRRQRDLSVDEGYFEQIDTEIKAYWLGYLFAEGSLDTKRYCLGVKIGAFDQQQLFALKDALQSEHPIKTISDRNAVVLKIGSKRLAKSLEQYNFGAGKAQNIVMPNLRDDLIRHFIRGFFDGDGWISTIKSGGYMVGFASCSKSLLDSFQMWFSQQLDKTAGSMICRKRNHIPNQHDNWRLQYGGRASPVSIMRLMYENSSVSLERKRNIYNSLSSVP